MDAAFKPVKSHHKSQRKRVKPRKCKIICGIIILVTGLKDILYHYPRSIIFPSPRTRQMVHGETFFKRQIETDAREMES